MNATNDKILLYKQSLMALTANSITATLLFQQLEYRFVYFKNGFYKFLSAPKKAHEKYRKGDSWTEEMKFSEKRFRNAFDKIGIRYNSKTAYSMMENPFLREDGSEAYFCSYYHKPTHMTFYFRNHKLLHKVMVALEGADYQANEKQYPKIPAKPAPDANSSAVSEAPESKTETPPASEADNQALLTKISEQATNIFSPADIPVVQEILKPVELTEKYEVLLVLAHVMQTTAVKNKKNYLRGLIKAVENNTFVAYVSNTIKQNKPDPRDTDFNAYIEDMQKKFPGVDFSMDQDTLANHANPQKRSIEMRKALNKKKP